MSGFKVTELWAWIATGEDGDEGVLAFRGADAVWVPLVCADQARIDSTRDYAQNMARAANKKVELRRFMVGSVVEVLEP